MPVVLRPEQVEAVDLADKFLETATQGERKLFASATGTGKSFVEKEVLDRRPGGILLTPSNDIVVSLLEKFGDKIPNSDARLRDAAAKRSIYTPLYFRNRLLDGSIEPPSYLIWDEVHHQVAESWSDVSALCGCPEIGFTATPYRGTPKSTSKFVETWGSPHWIYDYSTAIEKGFISLPTCKTVPLIDDDEIEVTNGEFAVKSVESVTRSRLLELARLIESYDLDRPTMVAVPTRAIAWELAELVEDSVVVTGDSTRAERKVAYADLLACRKRLIQIAVVGEGVDLAVRRLFDAAATLSPVRWVQLFGRLTRPGGESEYIGTTRNLLRHCYALHGVLPAAQVADAQALFGLGTRSGQRAFGLEGLGRFKVNPLPLANGTVGELYMLENSDGAGSITQYACILHPLHASPLWATRTNVDGTYARWTQCDAPEGFVGFASGNGSAITEKQKAWWKKAARRRGLNPEVEPNRRTFAALPVLCDLGLSLEV